MLNQVVLVGRLVSDLEIKETENGTKVCNITLAVPRSWKNVNGEYDTDFVNCVLWKIIEESTKEYCMKGDLVSVKGRIQTRKENDKNIMEVVAEKVTFLSSRKETEEE